MQNMKSKCISKLFVINSNKYYKLVKMQKLLACFRRMKSDIVAFRLQFCLPSLFLKLRRDWRDPAAVPIPFFRARDAWRLGKLGDKLGKKCVKRNVVSLVAHFVQLSSVSDRDRDD